MRFLGATRPGCDLSEPQTSPQQLVLTRRRIAPPQMEVTMGEQQQQQRKAGWLARWRERRRSRSARADKISRRVLQDERRNIDNAGKYGGGAGGG